MSAWPPSRPDDGSRVPPGVTAEMLANMQASAAYVPPILPAEMQEEGWFGEQLERPDFLKSVRTNYADVPRSLPSGGCSADYSASRIGSLTHG